MKNIITIGLAATISYLPMAADANDAFSDEFTKAFIEESKPYADLRYRFENVDQTGIANDANASTLRTNLGYKTGDFYDFEFGIEIQNVSRIFSGEYNDNINGNATYPVIVDVDSTELNELYLQYSGIEDTKIKLGRQKINIGNQRFIGSVGWRQNDQVQDGVNITNNSIPDTEIFYGYSNKIHRIFSDDSPDGNWEGNVHMINAQNNSLPEIGTVTGYAYLLDFDDSAANSSNTYGISLNGAQDLTEDLKLKYYAEYATQNDAGNNPTNYDADYYHIAPALQFGGLTATVGYEVLGSDNGVASFGTPLATLHKFNGWADKFLNTPANGLEDAYIDVTYKFSEIEGDLDFLNNGLLKFQYHDFQAEQTSADYGDEFGIYAKFPLPIRENIYVEAKYANYNADTFATDTEKFILGVGAKF